jgi:hypothetical protein
VNPLPLVISVFVHMNKDEKRRRWISEQAYYLSQENPNNSKEYNCHLAEEEFDRRLALSA